MDKIIDGLYLGDVSACSNRYMLKKVGITHILTMAIGMQPLYPKEFIYKCVDVYDIPSENLMPHWPAAIEFIRNAIEKGGSVLVHCYAGVSRSASTVIAYLMAEKGASYVSAATYVKKKRPVIFPNFGFQRQLMKLEEILAKARKEDAKSTISKSRHSIRSFKSTKPRSEVVSETRSNVGSTASAYRGKYA